MDMGRVIHPYGVSKHGFPKKYVWLMAGEVGM